MEVYTLAVIICFTSAATVALVLLYRVDHKYSGMLFNLTFVGCIYFDFSVLFFLKTSIEKTNSDMYSIYLERDFYAFSITCFSTSVAIVFGYVTMNRLWAKIFYGIFFFLSVCLIVGIEKMIGKCICIEDKKNTLEIMASVKTIESSDSEVKRVDKVLYCYYDLIDPVTASICLEYALIYVPASVLMYTTLRQSTFNERFWKPSVEKCTECQLNMSFCYFLATGFLIVIWILRPMYLLSAQFGGIFYDFPSIHRDIVPMVSLQALFCIVLVYDIKVFGFGKAYEQLECLNKKEQNNYLTNNIRH